MARRKYVTFDVPEGCGMGAAVDVQTITGAREVSLDIQAVLIDDTDALLPETVTFNCDWMSHKELILAMLSRLFYSAGREKFSVTVNGKKEEYDVKIIE